MPTSAILGSLSATIDSRRQSSLLYLKPVKLKKILFNKFTILALIALICIGVALLVWHIVVRPAQAKEPTYETVLPKDKSVRELGGWKRVSPPEKEPVFAYADTIDGIPITVSQQPLPQNFTANTDSQVAELAQKFNATNKLEAEGMTIYVGTSSKGPQSVIFTKNKLLILIKSDKKVSDTSWIAYAKSLD